jgi:hypothetical protein
MSWWVGNSCFSQPEIAAATIAARASAPRAIVAPYAAPNDKAWGATPAPRSKRWPPRPASPWHAAQPCSANNAFPRSTLSGDARKAASPTALRRPHPHQAARSDQRTARGPVDTLCSDAHSLPAQMERTTSSASKRRSKISTRPSRDRMIHRIRRPFASSNLTGFPACTDFACTLTIF